ncbi:DUF4416 family protein [candidate division WOR-3 bacterium]|uniref:DUF4416 family protein n=1 Tax=candidate division WOR-3 bacterium TaxID=2052148 RepID=A0A9D5K9K7_UNCW3|nr:DUF4416 family protein [candidate division WOR-3 bacterium]MBD3364772.1 DUF4416 family protein [candidate division WOR-3 bacterium]
MKIQPMTGKKPNRRTKVILPPREPQALLICGLLSPDSKLIKSIEQTLSDHFGQVALRSEVMPFDWTDYYNAEMGEGILRRWVVFSKPINLLQSWELKLKTCEIEDGLKQDGKRTVNIDPGLVRLDGLWLFSTKPAGHRTYLDEGIWIELTVRFLKERCDELPWTYPDHRDPGVQLFMLKARELLKKQLSDNE